MPQDQQRSSGGLAIQGHPINWAWSLRDLRKKNDLSRAAIDGTPAPESLRKRKEPDYILWAFSNKKDYKRLSEKIEEGPKKAILITKKYKDIVPRGIIAIGEISSNDLITLDDECMGWRYWPVNPEEEDEGWKYKFFIKIVDTAPSISESISELEQIDDKDFEARIKEALKNWASSIIPLVPWNLTQGSLVEISEDVLNCIYLLTKTKWRKSVSEVSTWDHKNVTEILENQKVLVPPHIVEEAVQALNAGKHIILVGAPGSGKTTLARAIAKAFGMSLMEITACSEWSRVDLIGGPVFVGGNVVWKCGALLRAIAMHYKAIEKGGRGVLLLIDEINRANLDKSFGEFFTIFGSSNPDEWYIPESILLEMQEYQNKGVIDEWGRYLLQLWEREGRSSGLKIPSDFRVIGTMNTYDRRYLFTLGQALLRRFAVIEITTLSIEELKNNINKLSEKVAEELPKIAKDKQYVNVEEKIKEILEKLVNLYETIYKETESKLELGVGLLIDIAKLAYGLAKNNDLNKAVDRAFCMIALPQLESLSTEQIEKVAEALANQGYSESYSAIKRFYPETSI